MLRYVLLLFLSIYVIEVKIYFFNYTIIIDRKNIDIHA